MYSALDDCIDDDADMLEPDAREYSEHDINRWVLDAEAQLKDNFDRWVDGIE